MDDDLCSSPMRNDAFLPSFEDGFEMLMPQAHPEPQQLYEPPRKQQRTGQKKARKARPAPVVCPPSPSSSSFEEDDATDLSPMSVHFSATPPRSYGYESGNSSSTEAVKLRNKEAAARYRQKNKKKVADLEKRVAELEAENRKLQYENESFKQQAAEFNKKFLQRVSGKGNPLYSQQAQKLPLH